MFTTNLILRIIKMNNPILGITKLLLIIIKKIFLLTSVISDSINFIIIFLNKKNLFGII